MPVTTRMSAPNYKIFEPDALDAIYAKGNLDPIMGGISYAFGNAHKMDNQIAAGQTLEAQDKFNKMAANLDAMEITNKTKQEALKIGGKLMELGEDPTKVLGSGDIYTNPADNLLPGLLRGKIQSEINKNNASATADRGAGSDTYKTTYVEPGSGRVVETTSKRKPGVLDMNQAPAADPKASTPVQSNPNASGNVQQQIGVRAKAAVGPDARLLETAPSGHSIWASPSTKKTVVFDPTGKQIR